MRMLLKVEFPVETANAAVKDGSLSTNIQSILEQQKPEAVYFLDSNGKRAALLILDLEDASQIPATVEPWMLAFNASVEIHPVMIPEDLAKAGPAFEQAVKKYG